MEETWNENVKEENFMINERLDGEKERAATVSKCIGKMDQIG